VAEEAASPLGYAGCLSAGPPTALSSQESGSLRFPSAANPQFRSGFAALIKALMSTQCSTDVNF